MRTHRKEKKHDNSNVITHSSSRFSHAALRNISNAMNPLLDFLIEAVSIVRSADARAAQTGINVACLATSSTQAEVILRESDLVRRFLALHPASQDVIESGKDPLQKERDDLAKFRKKMAARREKKRKEEERKKRLYSSGDGRAKKK